MAKKELTINEQAKLLASAHGLGEADALNFMECHTKVIDDFIAEQRDAGTKEFAVNTHIGKIAFDWADEEVRFDKDSGAEFNAPAEYGVRVSMNEKFILTANANVDYSEVPDSQKLAYMKKKTA